MATLNWQEVKEVRIGDTAPDPCLVITEADESTVRTLTNYSASVSFWYADAAGPHIVRAAPVDAGTGRINYRLRGDEYTTAGMVYMQGTFKTPSSDDGSVGRGHFALSTQIIRRIVTG